MNVCLRLRKFLGDLPSFTNSDEGIGAGLDGFAFAEAMEISPRPKIRNRMKSQQETLRRMDLSVYSRNIFGQMIDRLSEDRDLWEKLEARIGEILETREIAGRKK